MFDTAAKKSSPDVNTFILAQAEVLRAADKAPATRKEWSDRRAALRRRMFAAMGTFPEKPGELAPKITGVLKRKGYRIEKVVFQSRPDVWVTASAYVPEDVTGKVPAVLVVHGHWAGARRDPVVQARCLGLVKLGFFVLAVDAFGAGERYTEPRPGTYHGALFGATLWPVGQSLLGMQVYDNRRAVDYLQSRPEVDGSKLGVTGASGGGNQTMYAGALDERFGAVVPVCSVGRYQAYLKAACCVCEVLPGALRFTEEGDVLGLVAPRALMVINATKDGYQFSPGQAAISLERAKAIFKLYEEEQKVRHVLFESPHAYNQAMREAMYGWMTKWLKGTGDGTPIPEPEHQVETWDDLACYAKDARPAAFLFPPTFAAREAKALVARHDAGAKMDHPEAWEAAALAMRTTLRKTVFGDFPKLARPVARFGKLEEADGVRTTPFSLEPEPGLELAALLRFKTGNKGKVPVCLLLDFNGKEEALKHPLVKALIEKGWVVIAPDLRGTGAAAPPGNLIAGAPDHNSAEHAVWIGRPLLGQWAFDVLSLLNWMGEQPGYSGHFAVAGVGQAGVVALTAAGLFPERVKAAAALDSPVSFVTETAYGPGTRMGLLAPGLLKAGDVPHLAALSAPRRLVLAGGVTPQGKKLTGQQLQEAYAFTTRVYRLSKADGPLKIAEEIAPGDLAGLLL